MSPTMRLGCLLLICGGGCTLAAQASAKIPASQDDVERLRSQIASQQEQINELRRLLEAQQRLLEKTVPRTAAAPAPPSPVQQAVATRPPVLEGAVTAPPLPESAPPRAPLSVEIGGASITPTGFVDFSQVWRSKTVTSGLGTNFASIPYNNTVDGHRRQTLASGAFSRPGVRVDTRVFGFKVLGVFETDFLGYQPGNVATTTNSSGLRLRLAFADVQKDKWEVTAGQGWSLITPARKGISPLPDTLFLTKDLDPNIMTGLTWARDPGFRIAYHPRESVALAFSFESGNTYGGGSTGSGVITFPAAFAPDYFDQVDTGSGSTGVPNPNLDYLAKVAFDPSVSGRAMHFEVVGMMNRFAFYNPLNNQNYSKIGGGVAFNAGIGVTQKLTLFTNNFYSDGGGRYIFGQAPAFIIRGDGSPSLVHAMSTVDGLEYQIRPKVQLFAYYGGTYVGRNVTIDPSNGLPVGWGYRGAPNSHNRSIQEIAGGFEHAFWHNPNYGALLFHGQYSWIVRHPWYVAPGNPGSANLNMVYLSLRYALPGAPPEPAK